MRNTETVTRDDSHRTFLESAVGETDAYSVCVVLARAGLRTQSTNAKPINAVDVRKDLQEFTLEFTGRAI